MKSKTMKSKTINSSLRSDHRLFQRPSSLPRNTILCSVLIAAGASPLMAADWQGTAAGNWSDGTRWSPAGVPSGVATQITVAAPVTLNSAVPNITTFITSNGAQLNIESGASLTATGLVRFGQTGARSVLNFTGGSLTTAEARLGAATAATANFSGGTWHVNNAAFKVDTADSVLNLSGTAHLDNSLGYGMTSMQGTINQTGGTFTNGNANLTITGGTYNLSGGALYVTGGNRDIAINNGGTLRIAGSGSSMSFNRNITTTGGAGHLVFAFDNSDEHITTIQSQGFSAQRAVNLEAELQGGVLLSGTDRYNVWEAPSFSTSTSVDFISTPDNLWTTSIADGVNGLRDAIQLQLASGQLKGNADADTMNVLSFAAATQGFVTLSNVNLLQPLELGLDITGGTLSNFTDALTAANILWSVGSGDYDVKLALDPGMSGGTHFAWDFSSIDPGMQLQGLTVIPEPSSSLLVAAGLMATAMFRRRRA